MFLLIHMYIIKIRPHPVIIFSDLVLSGHYLKSWGWLFYRDSTVFQYLTIHHSGFFWVLCMTVATCQAAIRQHHTPDLCTRILPHYSILKYLICLFVNTFILCLFLLIFVCSFIYSLMLIYLFVCLLVNWQTDISLDEDQLPGLVLSCNENSYVRKNYR